MPNRDTKGRWQPGHSGNPQGNRKGRPPRRYSVATALAAMADQPQSIGNNGQTLTTAELAARWLWTVVRDGMDVRHDDAGHRQTSPVSTRDRLAALQAIMASIEPAVKVTADQLDRLDQAEADTLTQPMAHLTDDELAILEKLG